MKKNSQQSPPSAPTRALKDDDCPSCGKAMESVRGTLRFPVNGEEVDVPDVKHTVCPACHEVVLDLAQARALRERALEIYRAGTTFSPGPRFERCGRSWVSRSRASLACCAWA